ncbi:hypothetical protein [Amycolatopsis sp. NPDC057786]|uniref:hypothetical protein n=1 Tax=Amycolatopsis sp. NPDC057786 TaxID=3346250 RepID=UPI0036710A4E
MDSEVVRDLLDRHTRLAVSGNPDDVLTELTGVGLGHSNILPRLHISKRSQMSQIPSAAPTARALATLLEHAATTTQDEQRSQQLREEAVQLQRDAEKDNELSSGDTQRRE